MKNKTLNTFFVPNELKELNDSRNGNMSETYGIHTIKINENHRESDIQYFKLDKATTVINLDITLNEDFIINLGSKDNDLIYFVYCSNGKSYYKSNNSDKFKRIEELQPGIICTHENNTSQINIKKDTSLSLNIIKLNKKLFFKSFDNGVFNSTLEFEKLSNAFNTIRTYLYLSAFNIKIAEQLRITEQHFKANSITDLIHLKSHYHHIIALQMEQFYKEVFEQRSSASLSKSELKKIIDLTGFISQSPETQHTVGNLCKRISMSPAKLQEGFKEMHNTTVADFVRNKRIEKAEFLLNETELNISEIVYTIGLTSRSYFCKIFKKKYDCSPKKYRKLKSNRLESSKQLASGFV